MKKASLNTMPHHTSAITHIPHAWNLIVVKQLGWVLMMAGTGPNSFKWLVAPYPSNDTPPLIIWTYIVMQIILSVLSSPPVCISLSLSLLRALCFLLRFSLWLPWHTGPSSLLNPTSHRRITLVLGLDLIKDFFLPLSWHCSYSRGPACFILLSIFLFCFVWVLWDVCRCDSN